MLTKLYLLAARALPFVVALSCAAVLVPTLALAQDAGMDAGVAPTVGTILPPIADPSSDPGAVIQLVYSTIMNKQWGALVALLVTLIVWALRRFVPATSGFGAFLSSKLGGMISNFLLSAGGITASALLAGAPFTFDVVSKIVVATLVAAGGWAIIKNFTEALDERKAQAAGAAAAKAPTDTLNK